MVTGRGVARSGSTSGWACYLSINGQGGGRGLFPGKTRSLRQPAAPQTRRAGRHPSGRGRWRQPAPRYPEDQPAARPKVLSQPKDHPPPPAGWTYSNKSPVCRTPSPPARASQNPRRATGRQRPSPRRKAPADPPPAPGRARLEAGGWKLEAQSRWSRQQVSMPRPVGALPDSVHPTPPRSPVCSLLFAICCSRPATPPPTAPNSCAACCYPNRGRIVPAGHTVFGFRRSARLFAA